MLRLGWLLLLSLIIAGSNKIQTFARDQHNVYNRWNNNKLTQTQSDLSIL
ncbi:hypothetical protein DOY81_001407 [Sarcophaga bullata]|nr:hypothetical protein DOY81_001407 [Sarcophaga bullata]